MSRGNVTAVSTYLTKSGKRRIFLCNVCNEMFSETRDTVFYDLKTSEEKVIMALKMLLVRVNLSGIAFVLGVTEETIVAWLKAAAKKAAQINEHLLRELPVTEVQLDEMWNFIRRKQADGCDPDGEVPASSEDGRQWLWVSFAPQFRLLLAVLVGPRTLDSASLLVRMTAAVVAGIPCFFSDGLSMYLPALVSVYYQIKTFPRTGKRGRPKEPIKVPHPDLAYAQVIKEQKHGKLRFLGELILCGAERIKALGLSISTSLIERLNLTMRQALAPLTRKTLSFCKNREQMRRRVCFFQAFYNFARPHMSLRLLLPTEDHAPVGLFQPKWQHRTPAMAAGISDHIWSFRELLTAKFEPLLNQSNSG